MQRGERVRRFAAHAAVAVAIGGATACHPDEPPPSADAEELTFEVLHAGVDAVFELRGRERLAALPAALESAPVDVICLQGIGDPSDRAAVREALAGTFPVSLELPTDDATPIDEPTDPKDEIPPPPTAPPCAEFEGELGGALSCLAQAACTIDFGGDPGSLARASCASRDVCLGAPSLVADPSYRCGNCIRDHVLTGMPFAEVSARCTEMAHPLALRGQHGMMILSRFPLSRPALHVLPSEGTRRAIVGATLTTPRGAAIDVFCASLGPTGPSALPSDAQTSDPYPGAVGSPAAGWERENELQIDELIAFVNARRSERPAIVLGNFGASEAIEREGAVVLPAMGAAGAAHLEEAFAPAVAPAYEPDCTVCPENRLLPLGETPTWHDRIYLAGLDASAVRESHRSYLGDVVAIDAFNGPARVPLSMQYGFRARIALPP